MTRFALAKAVSGTSLREKEFGSVLDNRRACVLEYFWYSDTRILGRFEFYLIDERNGQLRALAQQ